MTDFVWYKIEIKIELQSEIIEIKELHINDANKLIAKLKENNFSRNFEVEFLEMATKNTKAKLEAFTKKTDRQKPTIELRDFLIKNANLW